MTRLLTTVAVSALMLSVAAPGLRAADAPSTGASQSGGAAPTMQAPMNQAQTTQAPAAQAPATPAPTSQAQSNPAQSNQTQNNQAQNNPQTSATAAKPKQVAHRAWHREDHMANELNRQELSQLTNGSTSYGSSR